MLNIKRSTPNINSRAPWLTAVIFTGPSLSPLLLTFSKTKQKQLAAFLPVVCDDKWKLMKKGTCSIYHLTISFWQIFWIKICTAPCFPYIFTCNTSLTFSQSNLCCPRRSDLHQLWKNRFSNLCCGSPNFISRWTWNSKQFNREQIVCYVDIYLKKKSQIHISFHTSPSLQL